MACRRRTPITLTLVLAGAMALLAACGPGESSHPAGRDTGEAGASTPTPVVEASGPSNPAAHDVVLRGDVGTAAAMYDCDAPRFGKLTPEQQPAIRDYVARMVRAGRVQDRDTLTHLMAAYQARDWSYLETEAVADACAHGPIPPRTPVFPEVGTRAPDPAMRRLDGSGTVRVSDFRGDYVVVDFWATWCVPCIEEMPTLDAWASRSPKRLKVLAVVHNDDLTRARTWVDRHLGDDIIAIADSQDAVARAYRLGAGIPVTYLLDPGGRVVAACDTCRYRAAFAHMKDILPRVLGW